MSDKSLEGIQDKSGDERVGAYLRRAREAAGISSEDLAREIRIAHEVLQYLENGNYEKLPVDAYVRGYINSICNRLELDRNKVLDWYLQEVQRERHGGARSLNTLDVGNPTASIETSNRTLPIVLVVLVLAFFAVMHFIRKESSTIAGEQPSEKRDTIATMLDTAKNQDTLVNNLQLDNAVGDTLEDTALVSAQMTTTATTDTPDTVAAPKETVLKFECIRDSTYIQVRRVGDLTWARILRATDKPRFVSHTDTMRVSVGSPEKTRLYINDERVRIDRSFFKVYQGRIIP